MQSSCCSKCNTWDSDIEELIASILMEVIVCFGECPLSDVNTYLHL